MSSTFNYVIQLVCQLEVTKRTPPCSMVPVYTCGSMHMMSACVLCYIPIAVYIHVPLLSSFKCSSLNTMAIEGLWATNTSTLYRHAAQGCRETDLLYILYTTPETFQHIQSAWYISACMVLLWCLISRWWMSWCPAGSHCNWWGTYTLAKHLQVCHNLSLNYTYYIAVQRSWS